MATKAKATEDQEAEKPAEKKTAKAKAAPAKEASAKDATAKAKPEKKAAPVKGKTVEKPAKGHKPNALQQPLQPSPELAAVVGDGQLARGEAVSKVWEYIKKNKLQNPKDGREILADDVLQKVFGKDKVTMFEMNKYLAQHLK